MSMYARYLLLLVLSLATPLAQAGTKHYYYTDAQGTVLAKADAQGNIVASYDYAPYGPQVLGTPPNGPTGYTGHVNDAESGFVYMQQRYYDPIVGRFIGIDPVGLVPGDGFNFNRFAYANNNFIGYIDPDGQAALWVSGKKSVMYIPVHFVGSAATEGNVKAIIAMSEKLQILNRSVSIKIISTEAPMHGVINTMDLSDGMDYSKYPYGEGVNAEGGTDGHINSSLSGWLRAALHDTLHFGGFKDGYRDLGKPGEPRKALILSGYSVDDIMANRSGNNINFEEIEYAKRNPSVKQCEIDSEGKVICK